MEEKYEPLATPPRRSSPRVPVPEFPQLRFSPSLPSACFLPPFSVPCRGSALLVAPQDAHNFKIVYQASGVPEDGGMGEEGGGILSSAVRRARRELLTLVIPGRLPPSPSRGRRGSRLSPTGPPPAAKSPGSPLLPLRARDRAPCAFLFTKEISSGR